MSAHRQAATGCTSCHGASLGHVKDERNNVKPDRLPNGSAIAGLCADCHKDGCTKSGQKAGCQDCHHYHALVDPRKPAVAPAPDERSAERETRLQQFSRFLEEGNKLVNAEQWDKARIAFQAALQQKPGDGQASAKLKLCERRLKPDLPGFEITDKRFDPETGLVRKVRVAGLGIAMVLVPGGEFEMGSERFAGSKPVHTVRTRPFYLGAFEITQAEWKSMMGSNPSAHQGEKFPDADRMPVEQVSWEDAQAFLRKLNEKVEGGGFRLPTEAEWERAARSGGAEPEPAAPSQKSPRVVGLGHIDNLGLHDMLGNVWEWCSSLSRPYPFDATDGRESSSEPGLRILRGGGFGDPADLLDPALRHTERPNRRLRWNGLRLARDVPDPR
jgi:formylglycine-generating enzyme required for sulfatase activity